MNPCTSKEAVPSTNANNRSTVERPATRNPNVAVKKKPAVARPANLTGNVSGLPVKGRTTTSIVKPPIRRSVSHDSLNTAPNRINLIASNKPMPLTNRKRPAAQCPDVNKKKPAMAPPATQSVGKSKIAAWDIKGKLKHAEEAIVQQKEKLSNLTSIANEQAVQLEDLKQKNIALQIALEEKTCALEETRRLLLDSEEHAEHLRIANAELNNLNTETSNQLEEAACKLASMEQTSEILHKELDAQKEVNRECDITCLTLSRNLNEMQSSLKQSQQECEKLKEQVYKLDDERKVLHNKVMELKGNIRVFCRVRPLLPNEMSENNSVEHLEFIDECSLGIIKGPKKTKSLFSFDRVFAPSMKQADVFEELSELVQSVIDGFNVCVFAYGQTGSGKTYTMEGGLGNDEKGMIPRSIDHIFSILNDLRRLGWKYTVETSFLEIYNEQVKDLLNGQLDKSYAIRNPTVTGGDMVITNLKVAEVTSASEINRLLNIARSNRAVAATAHNDHSSRSHFVFKLHLIGENEKKGKKTDATLSLVDLAGSERLVDISESDRVTETKNINRSLSNLGNVVSALSRKNAHVPYRNSKLTHLLQPSLGGNSKTLMLVNLSPREDCLDETLHSLRFAVRVNECHIGRARRVAQ